MSSSGLFFTSLISGGVAGTVVDVVLFPVDTIKTRLQSEKGFWKSGGLSKIYKGFLPAAAGSAPCAALFFCTYETSKSILGSQDFLKLHTPVVHMISASLGEVAACLIRVPVEIAKQRRQDLTQGNRSAINILRHALKNEGFVKGLYRGFGTTLSREIPFSLIQFPLWEYFKATWSQSTGESLASSQVALCGALAGAIAGGITTPFDVAKTRIMLAAQGEAQKTSIMGVLRKIYTREGISGLFAGFVPRVMWISIGGTIFFGVYDFVTSSISASRIFSDDS
ncbi:S-adenosylmethionine mitochondrial carrier protein homolog [Phlebotomus argentipes]|uniref:S-adenosylmethionine mitochondrial carrier protein homolog n=1 Tax=Phlebotomus argentipes TaxID=94469 RepID=UPI0028935D23|nr:S-adenosylmethionine mitochondrial carrier protein homolog [Phlebotomus argentipes]